MKNSIRVPLSFLMGSSLAAFGIGYIVAPTEPLDTEVTDSGILSTTTTQVLSAAPRQHSIDRLAAQYQPTG